jgi:hypothetical protein
VADVLDVVERVGCVLQQRKHTLKKLPPYTG